MFVSCSSLSNHAIIIFSIVFLFLFLFVLLLLRSPHLTRQFGAFLNLRVCRSALFRHIWLDPLRSLLMCPSIPVALSTPINVPFFLHPLAPTLANAFHVPSSSRLRSTINFEPNNQATQTFDALCNRFPDLIFGLTTHSPEFISYLLFLFDSHSRCCLHIVLDRFFFLLSGLTHDRVTFQFHSSHHPLHSHSFKFGRVRAIH